MERLVLILFLFIDAGGAQLSSGCSLLEFLALHAPSVALSGAVSAIAWSQPITLIIFSVSEAAQWTEQARSCVASKARLG